MGRHYIPYSCQDINEEDIDAVVDVLRSDFVTQGPAIPQFEGDIKSYCGAEHAVAVASGTAALHCACAALGIKAGSRVWTSPISFVASSNAALYLGATVDFVDIDTTTGNMDPKMLEQKLHAVAKNDALPDLLIPVHFGGYPCDMAVIAELCKEYNIPVLEDAAHALGAEYACGRKVGSCYYSDATAFSFHPVKPITTGEGGMVVTNTSGVAEQATLFRNHGITRDKEKFIHANAEHGDWYYEQQELGYHYRITDIQAALGSSQLKRLDDFIQQRRAVAQRYAEVLSDLPITLPLENNQSAWHLYVIQVKDTDTQKKVFDHMRAANIGVNVHYIPIHLQPYYRDLGFKPGDFPRAEAFYSGALSLPVFPGLKEEDMMYIVERLRQYY